MAPSQLQIATSVLQRLVKEEASYHKELESQQKRIADLEKSTDDEDGNREFKLKQEVSQHPSPPILARFYVSPRQALEESRDSTLINAMSIHHEHESG